MNGFFNHRRNRCIYDEKKKKNDKHKMTVKAHEFVKERFLLKDL